MQYKNVRQTDRLIDKRTPHDGIPALCIASRDNKIRVVTSQLHYCNRMYSQILGITSIDVAP